MKRIKLVGVAAVAVLAPVALTGCGGSEPDAAPAPTTNASDSCTAENRDPNSQLNVSTWVPTSSLDPAVVGGGLVGGTEVAAIYDALMKYNPETGAYEPFVAESLTANADSTEWTVTLRSGITFGNGDPLTADAVKFSLERMQKGQTAASAYAMVVTSVDVVDDRTVTYHLAKRWGGFPAVLAAESGMVVNPKVVASAGDGFGANPVGAGVGPFEPQLFAPGEQTVLKAKDDYWGGPVCVGTLRFISVPGARAAYQAYQKGEVDVVAISDPTVVHDFETAGGSGQLTALVSGNGIGMNSRPSSPFHDIRLRQAVVAALNLDVINQRAFGGHGIMSSAVSEAKMRIHSGVAGPTYDLERAKSLVAEAKADGLKTNVTLTCSSTANQDLVLTVQALLNQAGFDVKTEILSSAESLTRLYAGSFELTCGAVRTRDDSAVRQIGQLSTGNPTNRFGFADAQLDVAIDELYAATSEDQIKKAMAAVQTRWNEVVPFAPIYVERQVLGFSSKVKGLTVGGDTKLFFDKAYVA